MFEKGTEPSVGICRAVGFTRATTRRKRSPFTFFFFFFFLLKPTSNEVMSSNERTDHTFAFAAVCRTVVLDWFSIMGFSGGGANLFGKLFPPKEGNFE